MRPIALALVLLSLLLAGCGSTQSTSTDVPAGTSMTSGIGTAAGASPLPKGALSHAVTKAAVDFGTYDYQTIQQAGWAFLNDLTTSYKNAYAGPAAQYVTAVVDGKATATAKVISAGVISQSDGRAVVVVTIQQTLNGGGNSTFNLQMTLLKQPDGSWLVDAATPANGGAQ